MSEKEFNLRNLILITKTLCVNQKSCYPFLVKSVHKAVLALISLPVLSISFILIAGILNRDGMFHETTFSIPLSSEKAWTTVRSIDTYPKWLPLITLSKKLTSPAEPERWEVTLAMNLVPQIIKKISEIPKKELVLSLSSPQYSNSFEWKIKLEPIDKQITKITFSERITSKSTFSNGLLWINWPPHKSENLPHLYSQSLQRSLTVK